MNLKAELEARLALLDSKIEAENLRHETALERFSHQRNTIMAMIDLETSEQNPQEDMFAARQGPAREVTAAELEKEILALLKKQANSLHSTIKEILVRKGLGRADDPQFGRRVHGTLMSLRHRELVEQTSPSTWRLVSQSEGVS